MDWPSWPEQRPLRHKALHFHDLTHCKPLEREAIVGMYAEKQRRGLVSKHLRMPPLNMDLSWTKKGKEGLKNLDENWPETAPHIAKRSLQLSDTFQLASSVASSSRPSPSKSSNTRCVTDPYI